MEHSTACLHTHTHTHESRRELDRKRTKWGRAGTRKGHGVGECEYI